jgi:hypothetical protein
MKRYIDFMFPTQMKLTKNHRNNMTSKYYNELQNVRNPIFEIQKYSDITSYNVIAYRKKTCTKYNREILDELFGNESPLNIGASIRCLTNKYLKYGLYNNKLLTIEDIIDIKGIKVVKFVGIKKTVGAKFFGYLNDRKTPRFVASYARTAYAWQGKEVDNYYFPTEDKYFIDRRMAYTVVSRLKGDVMDDTDTTEVWLSSATLSSATLLSNKDNIVVDGDEWEDCEWEENYDDLF